MSTNISGLQKLGLMLRSLIHRYFPSPQEGQPRIHDFTKYECGKDYIWEVGETPQQAYMTGYGANIERGDRIILTLQSQEYCYQVQAIDYYSQPEDMWIASLSIITKDPMP